MIREKDPRVDVVFHNFFGSPEHPACSEHYRPSQRLISPSQNIDNTNYNWYFSLCP